MTSRPGPHRDSRLGGAAGTALAAAALHLVPTISIANAATTVRKGSRGQSHAS